MRWNLLQNGIVVYSRSIGDEKNKVIYNDSLFDTEKGKRVSI